MGIQPFALACLALFYGLILTLPYLHRFTHAPRHPLHPSPDLLRGLRAP